MAACTKCRPPFYLIVFLLAGCDDQLRYKATAFPARQADGSGVESGDRQAERPIAGHKRRHVNVDPGTAPEGADRANLVSKRRGIIVCDRSLAPASVRNCKDLASDGSAAVGIKPELRADHRSVQSLDGEGQVAIHDGAGIKADHPRSAIIRVG